MKKLIAIVLTLSMVIALSACAQPAAPEAPAAEAPAAEAPAVEAPAAEAPEAEAPAAVDPIIVKYAVTFPGTGTQAEGAEKLKELIEKHSEGRMQVEIYYSSQLGGNTESMEGLRMGTIEMTELSLTAISAYSDIWSTFSLPYLWDSGKQAIDVVSSDKVMEILQADVQANGMMIISWQDVGSRSLLNTQRSVKTPDDMKGLRTRVIEDPILVDAINAMGGSAVAMPWSECYSGLEQGTIDAVENNAPVLIANAMQEVAKHFSLTEHFILPDPVLISYSWFNGLSAENQAAILAAGEEFTEFYNAEIWPNAETAAIEQLKSEGVEVVEVDKDAFFAATQPVRDNFVANGSAGQAALYEVLMEVKGQN